MILTRLGDKHIYFIEGQPAWSYWGRNIIAILSGNQPDLIEGQENYFIEGQLGWPHWGTTILAIFDCINMLMTEYQKCSEQGEMLRSE